MATVNNRDLEKIWIDKLKLNNKSKAEWQLLTTKIKRKYEMIISNLALDQSLKGNC